MSKNNRMAIETGRGEIKDNALAALVTSKVFRTQVVKAKKGKGSYNRNSKHKLKAYPVISLIKKLVNSLLAGRL